ncbi:MULTISPECIES: hypothetical protein [Actinomadura]|uniref:Uncharacterized protein n=1 Tax=Actinomadura yumaensis TaxID=111807 RepID=A0ABW2CBA1_9ACTN|nr:hypothetical protein [Actinomadura sp. J1-007]MWK38063.1 hypothetical protein [Actinomadura sp. J1-007]
MDLWRPKRDVPDSALMPTYKYGLFMTGFLLAAVGLTLLLIAFIAEWVPNGNIVIEIVMGIGTLSSYWLAYLGLKMVMYARRRHGRHSNE